MNSSSQKAKFIYDQVDEKDWQTTRQQRKTKKWPAILKNSKELEAVILFGDEGSAAQWGSLARTWAPRGQQPVVKISGRGVKNVFAVKVFVHKNFNREWCYRIQKWRFRIYGM